MFSFSRLSCLSLPSAPGQVSGRGRALRPILLGVCAALILLFSSTKAQAQGPQCTFNMTNISFGTVDLRSGRPYDAGGTFNYTCTGSARDIVRICRA
ncbi:MAG: hypothetical protein JO182_08805 [Acidobacteriaceae bacterium]|nr:hypothetical protein [Acidobacteriaceae bacterium]MBV9034580.1 hypothetical protein [Acidobacteriaceae bacterium]